MQIVTILLPALYSFIVSIIRSPAYAFIHCYIPILLLLPSAFFCEIKGFPDLTFSAAALLLIGIVYYIKNIKRWYFTIMDLFIFAYISWSVIAECMVVDFSFARLVLFNKVILIFFPYMFGKMIMRNKKYEMQFIKKFIVVSFLMSFTMLYEFVFFENFYHRVFDSIFIGQGMTYGLKRYGFLRTSGSYVHPILASLGMVVAFQLHSWLKKNKLWEKRFFFLGFIPLKKEKWITWGLLLEMLTPFSRGPLVGAFFAFLVPIIQKFRNRWVGFFFFLFLGSISCFFVYSIIKVQATLLSSQASEASATVSYRWNLVEVYKPLIAVKPYIGWGEFLWPRVPGYASIDNNYLLILIQRGYIGLFLHCCLLFIPFIRVFRAMMNSKSLGNNKLFSGVFTGIFLSIIISMGTVWMDFSMTQIWAFLVGWSEAYLQGKCMNKFIDKDRFLTVKS